MATENKTSAKADDAPDGAVIDAAEAQEKGYFGVETDPTPNEHYTVAGVTAGKPTPETDPDAAKAARDVLRP